MYVLKLLMASCRLNQYSLRSFIENGTKTPEPVDLRSVIDTGFVSPKRVHLHSVDDKGTVSFDSLVTFFHL